MNILIELDKPDPNILPLNQNLIAAIKNNTVKLIGITFDDLHI